MKYGLMYYKDTDNIGDDIQTYAAMRFLPHIDYYIDRENLNCFIPNEKEYVSMIMNGWFLHNKMAWPPSPYINPLLLSMHFTSLESIDVGEKYLQNIGGEYLKKHAPIGCRDNETQNRLTRNGIENYFSGCMTLTINKFEDIERQDYICVVDVNEEIINKVKQSTKREVKVISHWTNPTQISNKSFTDRIRDVESLLKTYQGAHLIITERLHVALPSMALGTPVILVHAKHFEEDRLGSFIKYVDDYINEDFLNMDIESLMEEPKENNSEYLEIRNSLISRCEEFISKCENSDLDIDLLPDINEYYDSYVKNIKWYKELYEEIRAKCKDNWIKSNKDIDGLLKKLEKVSKEDKEIILEKEKHINSLISKKESLERELQLIYNSRSWKYIESIRKILKR